MSYIVVYQRADGSAGVEECGDLDLAIVTAERLRNVDSVERPRIFETQEIRYDFRPYYRVEVVGDGAASSAIDGGATGSPSVSPAPDAAFAAVAPAEAADSGSTDTTTTEDSSSSDAVIEPPTVPTGAVASEPLAPPSPFAVPATADSADDATVDANDALASEPDTTTRSGLFGRGTTSETAETADIGDVVDDAAPDVEPEPPRRGLFGR